MRHCISEGNADIEKLGTGYPRAPDNPGMYIEHLLLKWYFYRKAEN